ncbi:hypothetical protein EYF80_050043 [Liparis tanakae]|uniref:Uncharacterized protein n=1 Tax=Liparis tanakae TaxID=230148 RepID=A0A4Z2FGA8_9TELE|nr:hypothetical protein EYF80_050043 [Liparis tanakae]
MTSSPGGPEVERRRGQQWVSGPDQEGFSWPRGAQLSSLQYTVLEFLQRQPGRLTRSWQPWHAFRQPLTGGHGNATDINPMHRKREQQWERDSEHGWSAHESPSSSLEQW